MENEEPAKRLLDDLAMLLTVEPIETARLMLRPFRASDLSDLYEYLAQPEQRRLSGNTEVNTLEDARLVLDHILAPEAPHYSLAIVLKSENKVVGNLSLGRYPFLENDPVLRDLRGVSLSYVLNERYWRRGLMTELLRACIPVLFGQGKLDYIQSGYFSFNEASAALQRKLGMQVWTQGSVEIDGRTIETVEMILFQENS